MEQNIPNGKVVWRAVVAQPARAAKTLVADRRDARAVRPRVPETTCERNSSMCDDLRTFQSQGRCLLYCSHSRYSYESSR